MAEEGKRKVQQNGRISMPKEFKDDNDIEKGDYVFWKRHSRDKSKLIIEARDPEEDEEA
jgi:bifunctional DNA-binding transcriptional regulator/antitoxin component of YhaV-PrlF toxin-antitoxin module